jgi:hypothetical protein
MTEPIDSITAIHNAFRRDMTVIDSAALRQARGQEGQASALERFRFFNEVLVWHARGEEMGIFPIMESVAPSVSEAYERDHRSLDVAFASLSAAVSAGDFLETARSTAAFKFHLDIHLTKEDAHLYRLMRERVPLPDQGKAVGILASAVPQDRYPDLIAWMYPLLGDNDRENMIRIQQMVMPPPTFAKTKQLIQKAIGAGWAELTRRVPSLV